MVEENSDSGEKKGIEQVLLEETEKWLHRLQEEMKTFKVTGKLDKDRVKNMLENINAYIQDTQHFLDQNDYIRSFEAIVYAWGIYETMLSLKAIENPEGKHSKDKRD
jgi:uncharacterized protein